MSECRICLAVRKNAKSIFEPTGRSSTTFADMITYVASVKITRNDGITDQVCLACRKQLRDLYDFKLLILRANIQLHQKNNAHLKRIHFNDITDIKLEIDMAPADDKYLLKEYEDIKINLRSIEDSVCYKDTTIKIVEPKTVEVELDSQPMSVVDFLNSIKDDLEEVYDQDFDLAHHDTEMDSDEYLPTCERLTKYGKKHKKKKKSKLKNGTAKTNPNTKKVLIKPTWIDDLRVMATYEPKKPRERKKRGYVPKEEMCPYCGKITKRLSSHLILHREPRYRCGHGGCGRQFHQRAALLTHELAHGDARHFRCDQCVAAFHTQNALNSHQKSHDQTRRFVCETCNKAFKRTHQLQRHARTHNSANKTHACEQCNMSFFSLQGLRHHRRVHTGERPFKCELCSQPYSYKHDFNRHCLKKHGVFLKRRSVYVMNAEVLAREREIMRELMERARAAGAGAGEGAGQGAGAGLGPPPAPFTGRQGALAYEQALRACRDNTLPLNTL